MDTSDRLLTGLPSIPKSRMSTEGAIGAINENGPVTLPCGWNTAININDVERIDFNDLILWKNCKNWQA